MINNQEEWNFISHEFYNSIPSIMPKQEKSLLEQWLLMLQGLLFSYHKEQTHINCMLYLVSKKEYLELILKHTLKHKNKYKEK
jgi:hypothetical protein